jgi:hypothetical protein
LRKEKYILGKEKGVLETGKEYFRIKFESHKIIYFEMEGENFKLQMPSISCINVLRDDTYFGTFATSESMFDA